VIFLVVLVCAIFAVTGNILLKLGMDSIGQLELTGSAILGYWLRVFTSPTILLGFLLYALSSLLWLAILPSVKLNRIYPFFVSTALVLVTLGSHFFLRERVSLLGVVGLAVICLGIFVVARN